jgi:ubiquinone/menaquinone biosynthesis C-methylase UbiE
LKIQRRKLILNTYRKIAVTHTFYEPTPLEIRLTLSLGLTVLSPYYHNFVSSLKLKGSEIVLDFGSGSGVCSRHIAALLQGADGKLVCVDISYEWMRVIKNTLRRYPNVSYHPGSIQSVNLADTSFDVVVLHFVLHDIPAAERQQVLKTLAVKLKPGGNLLMREPQDAGLDAEEISQLATAAGLSTLALTSRKVLIGKVYDGQFIRH